MIRTACPRCGSDQAVNLKTNPLRMWPHGWCVNVLAPLGIGRQALDAARSENESIGPESGTR